MSADKDEPRETKADYLLDGSPEAVALVREARGLPPLNAENDAGTCEPKCHAYGIGCACTPRYVVTTPKGFTEIFNAHQIDVLVRLGLIEHERDGHVVIAGRGNGVGPLHHFYREAGGDR